VSTTATWKEPVATEPPLSLAVQVTLVVPSANWAPEGGVHETINGPSTVSDAVGAGAYVTFAPVGPVASTVCVSGTVIVGAASVTVTVNVPDVLFPAASRAVHVTVVRPILNVEPDAGEHVTGRAPSTESVADAWNETTAPAALVATAVAFEGSASTGAAVSRTVTENVPEAGFPCVSEAEHVTVVRPTGNVVPDPGVHVTERGPSTTSFAEAAKVTTAPAPLVADSVMSDGSVRTGPCLSTTVIWKLPVARFPARS
jgi:hypothetical protein